MLSLSLGKDSPCCVATVSGRSLGSFMLAGIFFFFFSPLKVARDQQFCGCFFVQPKTSLKELKTLTSLLGAKLVLTVATEAAACFKLHSHLPEEGSLETVVRPVYSSMICGRVL